MKDKGIIGAFMLYQDDRDFEGFKARVIHKILTPTASRETKDSAQFQFPSTALGGQRPRRTTPHQRYLHTVLEAQNQGLLDE
jgi:hypothetical protein